MSETPLVLGDSDANWEALANLVQHFRIKQGHELLCTFVADVSFRSDRNVDERTWVYIDFHAGAVSPVRLAAKGLLNPAFVHTEFRPADSVMKFEGRELHIIGRSLKVGRFMVRISPLPI
jgi:hypothetical protein